jgi:two-component system, OmpR family, response regulator ResD
MATHILIIADDPLLGERLAALLRQAVYDVTTYADPRLLASAPGDVAADLLLIAATSPGADAHALLPTVRGARPNLPVILLSARATIADEVAGLRGGADDYIAMPFEPERLLARIEAALRRSRPAAPDRLLHAGDGTLDRGALRFTAAGHRSAYLTPVEVRLLECLMRDADTPVSRATLRECVGGDEDGDHRLDFYIRRLRAKIEEDPGRPAWIRSVRGGYLFRSGRAHPTSGG